MNNINNNRTLGEGFGKDFEFNMFSKEEIYKPFVNGLDKIEEVRKALLANRLDNKTLAVYMPDILVDLDITRLVKILPKVMSQLSDESKRLFSDEVLLKKIDKRFLTTLEMTMPEEKKPMGIIEWSQLLSKDNIEKLDPFLLAYLVPVIMDHMSIENLIAVSSEIAKSLAPKDLKAITVLNYFDIKFSDKPHALFLKNNGRTLIFKPGLETKSTAIFRDKEWELDHTHIHLERENEEREYRFYQTRSQYEITKGTSNDPSLDVVGEVHSVFKRMSGKNKDKVKYMAVGIPLKIGTANSDFQNILSKLSKIEKIGYNANDSIEVPITISFRDVFMKDFSSDEVIYHSWGSLKSTTHAFKAGLRFNIIEKPILISTEQYNSLKLLFGDLRNIDPEKALFPIDRKADYRKIKKL